MARKLTANQQEYKHQIKRIRSAISKLKHKGYDVSALYAQYSTELPKRVTKQLISQLKTIKPRQLEEYLYTAGIKRSDIQVEEIMPTPVEETQSLETAEQSSFDYGSSDYDYPSLDYYSDDSTDEYTDNLTDLPNTFVDDTPSYEETVEEVVDNVVDVEAGKVYGISESGTIIEESDLLIDETDETIMFINADTGEIIKEEPKDFYNTPDLTDMAIEYMRDLANGFSPSVSQAFQKVIDYMIDNYGAAAVADAFGTTMNEHPDLAEKISNAKERYKGMHQLIGDIAEILDMPQDMREEMRDIITRDSMSDMEETI